MDNLKKLTLIIIRLQSLIMIIIGLMHWFMIAGLILIESIQGTRSETSAYIGYFIIGITYILFGIILYARSRSLAHYFVRSVEADSLSGR